MFMGEALQGYAVVCLDIVEQDAFLHWKSQLLNTWKRAFL